ncbi:MAG: 5'/3'-nucleotidase SurE [Armatimonadetes bacterium]|nr:5'/3'-nucleotidase SurE [Armatimonadota bacterium]
MRVLVTNDDGIHSPGLLALVHAVSAVAETFVVAPEQERSATGHAITLHKPLRVVRTSIPDVAAEAWATNGTPADCVALGILDLLDRRPDVVISGINMGANLGRDITYSGTVSGAMEGAIFGIPSIAISLAGWKDTHYDVAASFAVRLATLIVERGLPRDTLLNVNVPNVPREALAGVAITRQGRRRYLSRLEKRVDPRGRTYYWLTGEPGAPGEEEGMDSAAVARGFISVTPIQMEMTDEALIRDLAGWNLGV